ncbi:type 4b pilus protein PilO2 [Neptuniibacter sp. QD37_11]|uniref:type 4b pilus protein PilO2 n=1 Tax=Neptuniibacter sp. QD37_11 TaxID=3398209 RepID=UPI0039F4BF61
MKLININNQDVVVGLDWHIISDRKEVGDLTNTEEKNIGVLGEYGDGMLCGLTDDKSAVGSLSAALAFAEAIQEGEAILIHKIEDDLFWITASLDGALLPTGDKVVNAEELSTVLQDVAQDLGEQVQMYVSPEVAEELDIVADDIDFEEILQSIANCENDSYLIKKLTGMNPLIGVIGGIVILGVAGLWGYENFIKTTDAVPVIEGQSVAIDGLIEQTQNQDELFAKAKEQEIEWLKVDLKKFEPAAAMAAGEEILKTQDIFSGGWKIKTLSYGPQLPNTFVKTYERKPGATPLTLDAANDGKDIVYALDASTATVYQPHIFETSRMLDDPEAFIGGNTYGRKQLMHDMIQGAYGEWALTPIVDDGQRKEAIPGIQDPTLARQKQLVLPKLGFEIKESGYGKFASLSKIMTNDKPITITEINFELGDELIWSVKGELYEN